MSQLNRQDRMAGTDAHREGFFSRVLGAFGLSMRSSKIPAPPSDRDKTRKRYKEYTLLELYDIYDDMDFHWVFATILNTYVSETCQQDPVRQKSVWVVSKENTLVANVQVCFDNIMLEKNHARLTRNMCKYGCSYRQNIYSAGHGILGWTPWHPSKVRVVLDTMSRVQGFATEKNIWRGSRQEKISWAFDFTHFSLPGTDEFSEQGESLFYPMIRIYQYLVISEDGVLQARAQRGTDRNIVWLDTGDLSDDEALAVQNDYAEKLKRKTVVDPLNSKIYSTYEPWAPTDDLCFIRRDGEGTGVDTLSAAGAIGGMEDLNYWLNAASVTSRIPRYYFGGDNTSADADKSSLTQKSIAFARAAKIVRTAQILGYRRTTDIHLMMQDIDIFDPKNAYVLEMPPLSYAEEIERLEIIRIRFDIATAVAGMAMNLRVDPVGWTIYVLEEMVRMPREQIEELIARGPAPDLQGPQGQPNEVPAKGAPANENWRQKIDSVWAALGKAASIDHMLNETEKAAVQTAVNSNPALKATIERLRGLVALNAPGQYGRSLHERAMAQMDAAFTPPKVYDKEKGAKGDAIYESTYVVEENAVPVNFKSEGELATIRREILGQKTDQKA